MKIHEDQNAFCRFSLQFFTLIFFSTILCFFMKHVPEIDIPGSCLAESFLATRQKTIKTTLVTLDLFIYSIYVLP